VGTTKSSWMKDWIPLQTMVTKSLLNEGFIPCKQFNLYRTWMTLWLWVQEHEWIIFVLQQNGEI
jgi:hypothetical protein